MTLVSSFISFGLLAQSKKEIIWNFDNLDQIGGNQITVFGNPTLVNNGNGSSIKFDGIDDGIIVHSNPLDGDTTFTIEVLFKPDLTLREENKEQRFIHVQNPFNDERRLLIELRVVDAKNWFLDTYIRSDSSNLTLYAEKWYHPLNDWYYAALIYQNGIMKHYINGNEEMTGKVKYLSINNGNVSVGMRMNKRSFFKGQIKLIKFTNKALSPEQLLHSK